MGMCIEEDLQPFQLRVVAYLREPAGAAVECVPRRNARRGKFSGVHQQGSMRGRSS